MPKLLVVDDERISLALVKLGLKAENFEVITARDGEEALNKFKEQGADLIVLDIMMPNVNGYDFIAELKNITKENMPPIIILTANDKMRDVFEIEGVERYFVKPVNMIELVGEIKSCLNLL